MSEREEALAEAWAGALRRVETLEVGILTKGKPTLGMVLSSLLLQDTTSIRVHIVDTGDSPVIKRSDVSLALRLAFDRGIHCGYDYSRERRRAFSLGKLRLLESLAGPYICFLDDDVVMPSSAIRQMLEWIETVGTFGYVAPVCRNSPIPHSVPLQSRRYCPGAIFYQDSAVRRILLEYYETCTDVLDLDSSRPKHWEIAFLTTVFPLLGRRCEVQEGNVIYHLDYHAQPNWELDEPALTARSVARARELVRKHAPACTPPDADAV